MNENDNKLNVTCAMTACRLEVLPDVNKATKHKIDTAAITQQMTPSHFAEHGNTYEISMPEYNTLDNAQSQAVTLLLKTGTACIIISFSGIQ
jgi:hypothetical protein